MLHVHLEDVRWAMGHLDRIQDQLDVEAYLRGLGSEEYPDDESITDCSHCGEPCVEQVLLGQCGVYCCSGCMTEGDRLPQWD